MRTTAHRLTQSRRRAFWAIAVGIVPLLLAANIVIAMDALSSSSLTVADAATDLVPDAPTAPPLPLPAVSAPPSDEADATAGFAPSIDIEFPEPEPQPQPAPRPSSGGSGGSGGGGSGGSSGGGSATLSYTEFCSGGTTATATPGNSASSILNAINTERARIGSAPLSLSSSLNSAATSWSQSMLSATTGWDGHALAHNPNRPSGGENVGVTWSTEPVGNWAARIHTSLMGSQGHCYNIMNPQWSVVGIGSADSAFDDGSYFYYLTQNFQ